jgi:acyltransferase
LKGRTQWIDWAKTIGIWLVVFGHLPGNDVAVMEFIYAFHMPLFFFLSGYLAKSRSVVDTVKSGVVRLLIPYAIYYLLTWAWWYFFGFLRHPGLFDHSQHFQGAFVQPLFGFLFGVGYSTSISKISNPSLWFLVGLFNTSVIFSMLDLLRSRLEKFVMVALISCVPYVLSTSGVDLLFSLDSALMALPFYALGKLASDTATPSRLAQILALKDHYLYALVVASSFLIVFLVASVNGRADINGVIYGKSPLLFYFGGVVGIILVWSFSEICARLMYGPTIVTISRGSIVILALHGILSGIFLSGLRAFHVDYGLLLSAVISSAVVMICVPIIDAVETDAPILVGNRKIGSR